MVNIDAAIRAGANRPSKSSSSSDTPSRSIDTSLATNAANVLNQHIIWTPSSDRVSASTSSASDGAIVLSRPTGGARTRKTPVAPTAAKSQAAFHTPTPSAKPQAGFFGPILPPSDSRNGRSGDQSANGEGKQRTVDEPWPNDGIPRPLRCIDQDQQIVVVHDNKTHEGLAPSMGLHNTGNTCFVNSVLQVLMNTVPLTAVALRHDIKHCKQMTATNFCALCRFTVLLQKAYTHHTQRDYAISPNPIMSILKRIMRTYNHGRQEDAHEFLRFLLDAMQNSRLYGQKGLCAMGMETNVIGRIFGGFWMNCVECMVCHTKSKTYDPFHDISLDVRGNNSIEDALKVLVKVENLQGQNAYYCERCKKNVHGKKRLAIHRLPTVLTLQLKRFDHYGCKINRKMEYTERLNMRAFLSTESAASTNFTYRLYGVVVHHGGSTHSGHYMAYVRNRHKWLQADDSCVAEMANNRAPLSLAGAYILFYIRQTPPVAKIAPAPKQYNVARHDRSTSKSSIISHSSSNGSTANSPTIFSPKAIVHAVKPMTPPPSPQCTASPSIRNVEKRVRPKEEEEPLPRGGAQKRPLVSIDYDSSPGASADDSGGSSCKKARGALYEGMPAESTAAPKGPPLPPLVMKLKRNSQSSFTKVEEGEGRARKTSSTRSDDGSEPVDNSPQMRQWIAKSKAIDGEKGGARESNCDETLNETFVAEDDDQHSGNKKEEDEERRIRRKLKKQKRKQRRQLSEEKEQGEAEGGAQPCANVEQPSEGDANVVPVATVNAVPIVVAEEEGKVDVLTFLTQQNKQLVSKWDGTPSSPLCRSSTSDRRLATSSMVDVRHPDLDDDDDARLPREKSSKTKKARRHTNGNGFQHTQNRRNERVHKAGAALNHASWNANHDRRHSGGVGGAVHSSDQYETYKRESDYRAPPRRSQY